MKLDAYTKGVLTVIALALVTLAIQNAIQPAVAQSGVQKVTICTQDGRNCQGLPTTHVRLPGGSVDIPALIVSGTVGTYLGQVNIIPHPP
ncbi:MAG: hypothetical protein INF75_05710 [Roseomonas sp.]|nr:hypothetical protein [Roseomonas sp.]MCA3328078.1 hypothetical protein [Roseomonas sp.]MCA3332829.1 hypothetical protein [Roseomonas sp.]MCA3336625.1 hypothetical protein [Roseomonas sp.]MCA3347100.1 hypothetical protein [Roseomonas sp.]